MKIDLQSRTLNTITISKLALFVAALPLTTVATSAIAQDAQANCQYASSDSDGDGWGWENGASCLVVATEDNNSGTPNCESSTSDSSGDGWGWENGASCIVVSEVSNTDIPNCETSNADPDGDGWGWENNASCVVSNNDNQDVDESTNDNQTAYCTSSTSDSDNDGWGWEDGNSCIVQADDTDSDENTDTNEDTGTGTAESTAGVLCDYVDSTYNDSASVLATSNSAWTCSESERELTANGIPDHAVGEFPNAANPSTITESDVSVSYTLTPTESGSATTLGGAAGPQGYVLNGIKIDASTGGSCDDNGNNCSVAEQLGSWNIEALGQTAFDFGDDFNNAHVQPNGVYHYHGMPEAFITKQGGNSSTMTLIAWAADGFPIYARYGYSIANDATSALKTISGSYELVSEVSSTRPSIDTYALGTFAQDWQYVAGAGDLDECNGRFGVTPEFPGGIYHYYATDSYPYFQRCVKGVVEGGGGNNGGGNNGGGNGGGAPQ